jgi:hypothetical protein
MSLFLVRAGEGDHMGSKWSWKSGVIEGCVGWAVRSSCTGRIALILKLALSVTNKGV